MNDDKTINLTATINNQQYIVSYSIEQVKSIYDKLGISPAPVEAPAPAPEADAAPETGTVEVVDNEESE